MHGDPTMVARRAVVKSVLSAAAGMPLATVLSDPRLARAAAETLETVSIDAAHGPVSAALALPEETPAGAVLLIHEWWGLNDQIKAVAAELAREGYVALAVDLMDGQVATTPEQARAQTQALVPEEAAQTLAAWIDWLRAHPATTDRVATIGWCFGGAWSLNASLATPVEGTVIYYGRVPDDPDVLAPLRGPVLGHFGTEDQFITRPMVEGFEMAMVEADKPFEIFWYEANHAFANPSGARYDEADAQLAWQRTLDFLRATIGPAA